MGKTISSIIVGIGFGLLNGLLSVIRGLLPFGTCLLCLFSPIQLLFFFLAGLLAVRKSAGEIKNIFSASTNGALAGLVAGLVWAFINVVASITADFLKISYSALFAFGGTDLTSVIIRTIATFAAGAFGGLVLGLLGGFIYASIKLKL